jgi:hypothetical protein
MHTNRHEGNFTQSQEATKRNSRKKEIKHRGHVLTSMENHTLLGVRSLGLHWNGFLGLTNHQTGGQRFAEETGAF